MSEHFSFQTMIDELSTLPTIGRYIYSVPYVPASWVYHFERWTATADMIRYRFVLKQRLEGTFKDSHTYG